MPILDSIYMDAHLMPRADGRRTDIWVICNKRSGAALGAVRWYGPWRQHCFFPNGESLYSVGCLQALERFLAEANRERRMWWRADHRLLDCRAEGGHG